MGAGKRTQFGQNCGGGIRIFNGREKSRAPTFVLPRNVGEEEEGER